ncbi:MAG: hypothetical protein QOE47_1696, partial [Pyrinomonadaceae bacterium]|nr:hypothetical protein [Pyrinomonadaceae bacterium]
MAYDASKAWPRVKRWLTSFDRDALAAALIFLLTSAIFLASPLR